MCPLFLGLVLSLVALPAEGAMARSDSIAEGRVTVSPDRSVAGQYGTWTVTYHIGDTGMAQGGGIRVQLPDTWHAGDRNSANPLQATDPARDHYVSARASRPGVRLRTIVESETDELLVKSRRPGLDGRSERYVFVVRAELAVGRLEAGDSLSVRYGDTSGGSRGMRGAIVATDPEPVLVAVDPDGSGAFRLHTDRPTLTSISGPPAQVLVSGPSSLVAGRPAQLHVAFIDAHFNPTAVDRGEARFEVLRGGADLPAEVALAWPKGWETVSFTPTQPGLLRIEVTALDGLFKSETNPMTVHLEEPEWNVYWGDLHSHSRYSWDGVGHNSFDYARYVAGLDFYALTDHSIPPSDGYTHGLAHHVWDEYTERTEQYDDPGYFVTLHAYEASFGAPYGHHNVYFRERPDTLLAPAHVTLPEMWQTLTEGRALTIPHHTGKFPNPVRWEPHDPAFRRNFEIYSAHGLSETYDPEHPLAFEQSDFTSPSRSVGLPQFAQDAWRQGLELSTIASSDDHRSQPGKPHWGLVAVQAAGLTRAEIFDALYERRTYATTGARILLDFRVNGRPMGQRVHIDGPPLLEIEVHGTDLIEVVEVLRYSEAEGAFKVAYSLRPESRDFAWSHVDTAIRGEAIYYVRLRQRGEIQGRVAMAWSSPIWVR